MACLDLLTRFRLPSAVADSHIIEKLDRVCFVCVTFLREKACQFLLSRREQPILVNYGNDRTPLRTTEKYIAEHAEYHVIRKGRSCKSFLAERFFLSDGDGHTKVVFQDPIELADKTAWSSFAASRKLFPLPLELMHNNIAVHHHCYDGAVYLAMVRHQKQLLEALLLKYGDLGAIPNFICLYMLCLYVHVCVVLK
jgi:hypothetical protein